ncbi:MAG TPA: cytochrome c [Myxococcota bacterium]|jgi:mono/diheme cytochrome c family protein
MTRSIARTLLVGSALLALAMFAACGGSDEAKPAAEEPAPAPEPATEPAPTEAPAASAETPTAATFACIAGNADAGKLKYAQLCASCHGAAGAGDGVASAGLNPKPAHHNDGTYMNPLSNEHLVKVITEGGAAVGKSPMMAPWGAALGTQGVLDVAAFVRTLADPPYACP